MHQDITVSLRAIHDIFVIFVMFDITESVSHNGFAMTKVRMIGGKKVPRMRTDIEDCTFVDWAESQIKGNSPSSFMWPCEM